MYGGPQSQRVNHYWSVNWKDYLVTNYDIVYATIDGRGTGCQVTNFVNLMCKNISVFREAQNIDFYIEIQGNAWACLADHK